MFARLTKKSLLFTLAVFALAGCIKAQSSIDPFNAPLVTFDGVSPQTGWESSYEHLVRGKILAARGDDDGALEQLLIAVSSDPYDLFLRICLAQQYINRDEPQLAGVQLEYVLSIDPGNALGWLTVAKYYVLLKKPEYVLASALRATEIQKDFPEALLWLADYHRSQGQYEEAAKLDKQVLVTWKFNSNAHLALAGDYLHLGKINDAAKHLKSFARLRPDQVEITAKIAAQIIEQLEKQGHQEKALELKETLALDESDNQ